MVPMALAAWVFVGACLLVIAAGVRGGLAYPLLVLVVVGVGECLHTTALMPLAPGGSALALEVRLPETARLTPRTGLVRPSS